MLKKSKKRYENPVYYEGLMLMKAPDFEGSSYAKNIKKTDF